MFSGIVVNSFPCSRVEQKSNSTKLFFPNSSWFQDVVEGDSVAVDGVCLTVESLSEKELGFFLSPETLKITGWNKQDLKNRSFNLEKSVSMKTSLGGHFVTGHVDGLVEVVSFTNQKPSFELVVRFPASFQEFFWRKGYITLNGVSLTVNEVNSETLKICLVPKTLDKTNLSDIKPGDMLNFEVDYFARFFLEGFKHLSKKL